MSVDLGKVLEDAGALLRGHFVLTSGRHSDIYLEKFRILEQPPVLTALATEIAAKCAQLGAEAVAGPTTGGIIIAFEVARQMGLPAVYVESEDGKKVLRRGKTLPAGQKVLIVDDVLTTGLSVVEVAEVIRAAGGVPVGVAVLIDRSETLPDFGCPLFSAYRAAARSYAADALPPELASIPAVKPGTRATN